MLNILLGMGQHLWVPTSVRKLSALQCSNQDRGVIGCQGVIFEITFCWRRGFGFKLSIFLKYMSATGTSKPSLQYWGIMNPEIYHYFPRKDGHCLNHVWSHVFRPLWTFLSAVSPLLFCYQRFCKLPCSLNICRESLVNCVNSSTYTLKIYVILRAALLGSSKGREIMEEIWEIWNFDRLLRSITFARNGATCRWQRSR